MKIGYARVSTQDQNIDLQLDALKKYGCTLIYQEKRSGKNSDRPELKKMLQSVREGDVLVIWKLDRLGRSLKDLIHLVSQLQEKKVDFVSLQDSINTSTPQGRLFFHIGAAFAEFEREIIRERTLAGLASARARGRIGGRPKGLSKEANKTALAAKHLYEAKRFSVQEICNQLTISKPTFYRYIKVV
jgi:DNA invertase Pin-like site-specific DNA recombinase